jgi:hypothetical protein
MGIAIVKQKNREVYVVVNKELASFFRTISEEDVGEARSTHLRFPPISLT